MNSIIKIASNKYSIEGDEGYLTHVGTEFEPSTIALFSMFCNTHAQVIDIGANIGLTALALSNICPKGKIIAIEPVKKTCEYLIKNIDTYHFAAGKTTESLPITMHGVDNFLAGSFVGDNYTLTYPGSFSEKTFVKSVDNTFNEFGLTGLDFIKLDVEGYELTVLEGMRHLLQQFKLVVMMEMNHFCLNVFQRITIPEFREKLLSIFPCVFSIDGKNYGDLADESEFYEVAYGHIAKFKFMSIIAGFDKTEILNKFKTNNFCSIINKS